MLIPIIAAVLLIGGASAYYFGYYSSPSVIYSQSLGNTGKGYDKLVDFADKQSKLASKGYTGAGSYKFKTDGFSTDGNLGYKGNSSNSEVTFDFGLAGTRINADIRTFKTSNSATPDFYFKVGGLKGLGTTAGEPDLDPYLNQLDNQWIVIDHTFYDSLSAAASQSNNGPSSPSHDQVMDEARAFGKVNQQYLFSTNKDKAVTKVVKKYGRETVDGHKTYHYKIALQKDNVKKYILAQRDALKASKLNDWLKANKYDKDVYNSLTDEANSAKDIDESTTYDIWMDTGQRIVYKVRFNGKDNPASNYVDVGLDYKGGDNFPFFVSGKSDTGGDDTTFDMGATVNTKTAKIDFKATVKATGSDAGTFTADFNLQPSPNTITIEKPSGAKPINQVLNDLGFGDLTGSSDSSAASSSDSSTGANSIQLRNLTGGQSKSGSSNVGNLLLRRLLGQ